LVTLPVAGQQPAARVRVVEDKKLSQLDYDKFTADFFAPQPWLDGKGGIDEDGTRHVIQVTAQDRQTLHIDPQGYDYARYVGVPEADVQRVMGNRSFVVAATESTQTLQLPEAGAYESAVQNFVRGGGNEKDARRTLDSELAGDYDPKHLPAALVFHGFAKPAEAEKLAAAIIAEENKKMLDKEDRKSSEFHVAMQAEEAAGKDKPKPDERTAEKSSELEGDKPDRPPRPRLRQATRKAAAMDR
jgi:hypothetical protein